MSGVQRVREWVCQNAWLKAQAVSKKYPEFWILAADTVVVIADRVLGKPKDLEEAWQMLATLSGKEHQVYTGYVLHREDGVPYEGVEQSDVTFQMLTPEQIQEYCTLVNPLDKAGAYGIQEHKEKIIQSYRGSFSNIMGLPIEVLKYPLQQRGLL